MEPSCANRTCKACRISKVKCDVSVREGADCSRCARLNLDCVRESRGNLSTGASRLKAGGAGALKKVKGHQRYGEIEMLTRMALASSGPQRVLAEPLLRRCAQVAWSRNDTKLMAWVLEQAAARGLPLSAFAPTSSSSSLLVHIEPTSASTPPPFIRALLGGGGDTLAVAFLQCDAHTDWIANDNFDRRVCSRQSLHEARTLAPCAVSALFSPAEEIEPFERDVYAALFAGLAPTAGRGSESCAAAGDNTSELSAESEQMALRSELVDVTSMWRVRLREDDEYVRCRVVFRCMVLRGGAEIWVAGCYTPESRCDASGTSNEALRDTKDYNSAPSKSCSPPRKRHRAKGRDAAVGREQPHAGLAVVLDPHGEQLEADSLLEQLQATSTDEVLRLLDAEE